jgi:hypothetical protein
MHTIVALGTLGGVAFLGWVGLKLGYWLLLKVLSHTPAYQRLEEDRLTAMLMKHMPEAEARTLARKKLAETP